MLYKKTDILLVLLFWRLLKVLVFFIQQEYSGNLDKAPFHLISFLFMKSLFWVKEKKKHTFLFTPV